MSAKHELRKDTLSTRKRESGENRRFSRTPPHHSHYYMKIAAERLTGFAQIIIACPDLPKQKETAVPVSKYPERRRIVVFGSGFILLDVVKYPEQCFIRQAIRKFLDLFQCIAPLRIKGVVFLQGSLPQGVVSGCRKFLQLNTMLDFHSLLFIRLQLWAG